MVSASSHQGAPGRTSRSSQQGTARPEDTPRSGFEGDRSTLPFTPIRDAGNNLFLSPALATSTPAVGLMADPSHNTSASNSPLLPGAMPHPEAGPSETRFKNVTTRKIQDRRPSVETTDNKSVATSKGSVKSSSSTIRLRRTTCDKLTAAMLKYKPEDQLKAWAEDEKIALLKEYALEVGMELVEEDWVGPLLSEKDKRAPSEHLVYEGPPRDLPPNPQSLIY